LNNNIEDIDMLSNGRMTNQLVKACKKTVMANLKRYSDTRTDELIKEGKGFSQI
jgi:hypothetical protein